MKRIIIIVVILIFAGAGYFAYTQYQKAEEVKKISSFDECAAGGFPVMDSYPARCVTSDGRSFTQEIGNELQFTDEITVSSPRPNQKIISPFKITGQARGNWYFEGSFPFELFDGNNTSLGKGTATANGEWMTENFVPFSGELQFARPQTKKGKLIIHNSNPSGLPENEKTLEMPIEFN